MFKTSAQRLLLISFVLLITLIPGISYLLSIRLKPLSTLPQKLLTHQSSPTPKIEPINKESSKAALAETNSALSFGPTLTAKINVEGRTKYKQALKAFLGIASPPIKENPKYLLTFTVNFSQDGTLTGVSLAGLEIGQSYVAYIKGPSQIATASAFLLNPTETLLNNNQPLNLISGDLNEDNTINSVDYSLLKDLLGLTKSNPSFNERADFNLDGVINTFDLNILTKNLGKTGASGVWVSPVPIASSSGTPAVGGVWLWMPNGI